MPHLSGCDGLASISIKGSLQMSLYHETSKSLPGHKFSQFRCIKNQSNSFNLTACYHKELSGSNHTGRAHRVAVIEQIRAALKEDRFLEFKNDLLKNKMKL